MPKTYTHPRVFAQHGAQASGQRCTSTGTPAHCWGLPLCPRPSARPAPGLQALAATQAGAKSGTKFSMVRFGNVLGSSGSVVPKFRQQIRDGGPITLTHPEVTRYFMTIPEAAQLVIQAGAMAKGCDVFVLDMGQPVKIMDLARRMVELSGLTVKDEQHPEGDIEIAVTGWPLLPRAAAASGCATPRATAWVQVQCSACTPATSQPPGPCLGRVMFQTSRSGVGPAAPSSRIMPENSTLAM